MREYSYITEAGVGAGWIPAVVGCTLAAGEAFATTLVEQAALFALLQSTVEQAPRFLVLLRDGSSAVVCLLLVLLREQAPRRR